MGRQDTPVVTRKYLVEITVETDSETVFSAFSLDLSEEKMDQITAPSNEFQQRHFRGQYTYYTYSANGRGNSLHSHTFFLRTQKKKIEVTNISLSFRLQELGF